MRIRRHKTIQAHCNPVSVQGCMQGGTTCGVLHTIVQQQQHSKSERWSCTGSSYPRKL